MFQSVMNAIVKEYLGCSVLMYYGRYPCSITRRRNHLEQALRVLQEHELYIRLSKNTSEKAEVMLKEHLVGVEDIKINAANMAVVKDWPVP